MTGKGNINCCAIDDPPPQSMLSADGSNDTDELVSQSTLNFSFWNSREASSNKSRNMKINIKVSQKQICCKVFFWVHKYFLKNSRKNFLLSRFGMFRFIPWLIASFCYESLYRDFCNQLNSERCSKLLGVHQHLTSLRNEIKAIKRTRSGIFPWNDSRTFQRRSRRLITWNEFSLTFPSLQFYVVKQQMTRDEIHEAWKVKL